MIDALTFGPAGGLRFSRNTGRSMTSEALGAIRYPSPFFDIAHTYLPSSFKTMLRWCRYYYLTNPIISAVCSKMAEYPVTDLVFDTENETLRKQWEYFFHNVLKFKMFEVEAGLDYNVYGNALISMAFPFQKLLICKHCNHTARIEKQKYIFREYKFVGECQRCGNHQEFQVRDHYVRSVRDIRLIRWNPEYITVQHNEATGESRYYYVIPPMLANDVRMAKRHIIERIPQVFMEALRQNKALLFSRDNIYHMKRPTIAQKDKGWGMPMILPVLKDTFYLQVLRKAQEAIAVEHIVPLRLLFPQTASPDASVYCTSLDTLVETRDGPLPASEVKLGDYLKSRVGSWEKVEAIADRPVRPDETTREFTVASLPAFPFTLSEEHPVWAATEHNPWSYDGVGEPDWVDSKDLKEGDFVLYPVGRKTWSNLDLDLAGYVKERAYTERYIYRRLSLAKAEIYEWLEMNGLPEFQRGERETFLQDHKWDLQDWVTARSVFTEQESVDRVPRYLRVTEELAYIIGLYAAEGFSNGDSASLALNSSETNLMDRMDEALMSIGMGAPTRHFHSTDKGATYATNDVILGEFLKNACGHGAGHKKLPRFIMEAPDGIALAALEGLFSGDGSCTFTEATSTVGLVTTSPSLAVGSRQLLLSMGYIPTISKRAPKEGSFGISDSYEVRCSGAQAESLAGAFGWPVVGKTRVKNEWSGCGFIRDGYVYLRVRKVAERPVSTVRGFQMAGDKSFCVVGVATHNSTVNLTQWRDKIEQEIVRWRLDNNYIPLLPIPVGQQTLGGDGRALMLAQEYRVWCEHIISGMGVPIEFYFGGMQFSGSNVSMRILENHFLDQRTQRKQLVTDFIMPNVSAFMGWEPVPCHYKRFKMADDLQRSALYLQMNQAGKLSDKSLMEDMDWDAVKESEIISIEQKRVLENQRSQALAQAGIQGEAQLVQVKYQMRGQKIMMEQQVPPIAPEDQKMLQEQGMAAAGQPGVASPTAMGAQGNSQMAMMNRAGAVPPMPFAGEQQGQEQGQGSAAAAGGESPLVANQPAQMDIFTVANQVVGWLNQLPEHEKQKELVQMQQANPQLYSMVLQLLQQSRGANKNSAAMPLPEQRPPMRGPEASSI